MSLKANLNWGQNRWSDAIALFILFIVIFVVGPTIFLRTHRQDLDILLVAASNLSQRLPVYVLNDNPHTKPPLMTLTMIPFAKLPKAVVFKVWDLLNLGAFILLVYQFSRRLQLERRNPFAMGLVILLCLNQWNGEIRLGQFNLLMYAGILLLVWSERSLLLGSFMLWALLFKPVNIFLLPWALVSLRKGRLGFLFLFFITLLCLILIYGFEFGWTALIRDHHSWLEFVEGPVSSAWLGNLDGLASWLNQVLGYSSLVINRFVLVAGLSGSLLVSLIVKDPVISSCWIGLFLCIFSPLPFKHNYVLLVGFYTLALRVLSDVKTREGKWFLVLSLIASFIAFQVYSPTTFHWKMWTMIQPPTLGFYTSLLLALGLVLYQKELNEKI